jgi:hypothetical protein
MPVYAIIRDAAESNNSSFGNRITKRFPRAHYSLGKGQWLIATTLNIQQLSAELKIGKGSVYTGTVILKISDYYGLHNKKLWSWLRDHSPDHGKGEEEEEEE